VRWTLTARNHGLGYSTLGLILIIVGAIVLIGIVIAFATGRRPLVARRDLRGRSRMDVRARIPAASKMLSVRLVSGYGVAPLTLPPPFDQDQEAAG
jgi:FtsZ-interacting cell division protein ZipA